MRGREDGASALGATGLLGSPELGQDLAPRQRGAGRGSRAARVGARHTQTGPPWSCQPGLPHALSCLPFLVSPGGGGEGQPGSSGDLVCGVSFGRRGWKRAAAGCGQIAGFPSRCLHWELTCGWRGESPALGSPARTAPARGGGATAPLAASLAGPAGFAWKLQDFLPPRYAWEWGDTLGTGAGACLRVLWEGQCS